jgi:sarcosine oxidase subunit alpha
MAARKKTSASQKPARLPAHPAQNGSGERRPITFNFDGTPVEAYEGDSVAAALFADGRRIFSRSFKYHRPRGLLCCAGRCPTCLMNLDGTPNVRSCVTPARDGMEVKHQNAWPSLEVDALAVSSRMDKLMPVGFYYKTFIHPKPMWPVYEHFIKHLAGLGVVDRGSHPEGYHHEYRTTEVAVVGGGPAGMMAALTAARAGQRVTLIDEQEALGGMLRGDTRSRVEQGEYAGQAGYEIATRLAGELEAAGVTVWTGSVAFGAYEGNQLAVQRDKTLVELRYQRLVLATGAFERPAVFSNNDLPGIMLGTGAQRLLRLHGIKPGERALIATSHDGGLELAEELLDAGITVGAVADTRRAAEQGPAAQRLASRGVKMMPETTLAKAEGTRHVERVVLHTRGRSSRYVRCDLLCLSLGWEPAINLIAQEGLGTDLQWDDSRSVFSVGEGEEEMLAVGSVTGAVSLDECLSLGAAAGRAATGSTQGEAPTQRPQPLPESLLATPDEGIKRFVCVCVVVSERDIAQAFVVGFDHIDTL